MAKTTDRSIAVNRRAFHEYHVEDTYTAGIVLQGTEVKSLREGKASLTEGFARVNNGEVFLYGVTIQPYKHGTHYNHDPVRTRKLLLKKDEIRKLTGKLQSQGLTLIPLKMYFDRCWVKVELGVCKGKKLHDKREAMKTRDTKRELARVQKSYGR